MTIKGTLEGYLAAEADANDELRHLDITIARVKRDLDALVTQRVGARLKADTCRELARVEKAKQVHDEITSREVEIARWRGITLVVGDELTSTVKVMLRG